MTDESLTTIANQKQSIQNSRLTLHSNHNKVIYKPIIGRLEQDDQQEKTLEGIEHAKLILHCLYILNKKVPSARNRQDLRILQFATRNISFFDSMIKEKGSETHRQCVKYMCHETFQRNFYLYQKGDMCDRFFILLQGECEILIPEEIVHQHDNGEQFITINEVLVGKLKEGESFGEVNLLNQLPVNASVKCSIDSQFFVLHQKDFTFILAEIEHQILKDRVDFLSNVQIFSKISRRRVEDLMFFFKVQQFIRNSVIYKENDTAQNLYIVKQGKVSLERQFLVPRQSEPGVPEEMTVKQKIDTMKIDNVYKQIRVAELGPQEIFGQIDCLVSEQTNFTAICTSQQVELYIITQENVENPEVDQFISSYLSEQIYWLNQRIIEIKQTIYGAGNYYVGIYNNKGTTYLIANETGGQNVIPKTQKNSGRHYAKKEIPKTPIDDSVDQQLQNSDDKSISNYYMYGSQKSPEDSIIEFIQKRQVGGSVQGKVAFPSMVMSCEIQNTKNQSHSLNKSARSPNDQNEHVNSSTFYNRSQHPNNLESVSQMLTKNPPPQTAIGAPFSNEFSKQDSRNNSPNSSIVHLSNNQKQIDQDNMSLIQNQYYHPSINGTPPPGTPLPIKKSIGPQGYQYQDFRNKNVFDANNNFAGSLDLNSNPNKNGGNHNNGYPAKPSNQTCHITSNIYRSNLDGNNEFDSMIQMIEKKEKISQVIEQKDQYQHGTGDLISYNNESIPKAHFRRYRGIMGNMDNLPISNSVSPSSNQNQSLNETSTTFPNRLEYMIQMTNKLKENSGFSQSTSIHQDLDSIANTQNKQFLSRNFNQQKSNYTTPGRGIVGDLKNNESVIQSHQNSVSSNQNINSSNLDSNRERENLKAILVELQEKILAYHRQQLVTQYSSSVKERSSQLPGTPQHMPDPQQYAYPTFQNSVILNNIGSSPNQIVKNNYISNCSSIMSNYPQGSSIGNQEDQFYEKKGKKNQIQNERNNGLASRVSTPFKMNQLQLQKQRQNLSNIELGELSERYNQFGVRDNGSQKGGESSIKNGRLTPSGFEQQPQDMNKVFESRLGPFKANQEQDEFYKMILPSLEHLRMSGKDRNSLLLMKKYRNRKKIEQKKKFEIIMFEHSQGMLNESNLAQLKNLDDSLNSKLIKQSKQKQKVNLELGITSYNNKFT